ncbi:tRNA-binding protein, partial [Bacillus licheniformis]|uniref:tRNA-binding protein n=1 Tax=Bacillus licheniformis TaxID=1402 RepID=UPI001C92BFA2
LKLDIGVGRVLKGEEFGEGKVGVIKVEMDFGGEIGVKCSRGEMRRGYTGEKVVGGEVTGVVKFSGGGVGGVKRGVLVLV